MTGVDLTPDPAGTLNPSTILDLDILEGHNLPQVSFGDLSFLLLHYIMYLKVVLYFVQEFCVWEGGRIFLY